jgi:hypothetical protein
VIRDSAIIAGSFHYVFSRLYRSTMHQPIHHNGKKHLVLNFAIDISRLFASEGGALVSDFLVAFGWQMFSEFGNGGDGITKEVFGRVMRDILLGLGDGLERDPVAISTLEGTRLQQYAESAEFEVEAVTAFSQLDADMNGSLKASAIKTAMQRISVEQGMPPQTDASVRNFKP